MKDGNGKVLTRAYNCHRLKLWLEPNKKAETEPNSKSNANQKWKGDHDLNSQLKKTRHNMVIASKFKKEMLMCVMTIILLNLFQVGGQGEDSNVYSTYEGDLVKGGAPD